MKKIFRPARKKTILIIDHDPLVARVHEETLQRGGFNVVIAGDRNDFIAKPFLQVELVIKALTYLFKKNFRPLPSDQRSTSPMTMSTDPSMTMTSATV